MTNASALSEKKPPFGVQLVPSSDKIAVAFLLALVLLQNSLTSPKHFLRLCTAAGSLTSP
jgi:hypothetical protein